MAVKGYAFNEFDARYLSKVAKERHLLSQFERDNIRFDAVKTNERIWIVTLASTLAKATLSSPGVWSLSSATCKVKKRDASSSEEWSQITGNTITAFDLITATNSEGDFERRVFNPSATTDAPASTPLVAVQDIFGDLYLVIPGSGTTTTLGVPFFNNSGVSIPPFAPMWVTGDAHTIAGTRYVEVSRPTIVFQTMWLVNGPTTIPSAGSPSDVLATGRGFWLTDPNSTGPLRVPDSFAGLVTVGDDLGITPDPVGATAWAATPNVPGWFTALSGTYVISGVTAVDARQRPMIEVYGKAYAPTSPSPGDDPNAALIQNADRTATCQFEIWYRSILGTLRAWGWDKLTVYDIWLNKGDKVNKGTFGKAHWIGGIWEADFACDQDNTDTAQQSPGANQDSTFVFTGSSTPESTNYLPSYNGSVGTGLGTK